MCPYRLVTLVFKAVSAVSVNLTQYSTAIFMHVLVFLQTGVILHTAYRIALDST